MPKVPPMEKIVRNKTKGSLIAFLDGKKNINWIKSEIETSGVLKYK